MQLALKKLVNKRLENLYKSSKMIERESNGKKRSKIKRKTSRSRHKIKSKIRMQRRIEKFSGSKIES